jgi:hypothetical protein
LIFGTARQGRVWPDPALVFGDAMEIILKHDGPIPSGQRASKHSSLRHQIRAEFSQQIRRHWKNQRGLLFSYYSKGLTTVAYKRHNYCKVSSDPDANPFFRVDLCGFSVIPIVSNYNWLGCELDVTFLGDHRRPFRDIDNQVKFVVDTLRMPHPDELPGKGEELFCLLEDDSLITKYCVKASYGGTGSPPSDVLLITAKIAYSDIPSHPALAAWR